MKILHLIDSGGLYGAERMLLALVAEQVRQGLEPVILSAGDFGIDEKPLESEARKLGQPVVEWRMKPGLNLSQALAILKWAEEQKIDVLHSHGYKFNILMGVLPHFTRKQPLISTLHGYVDAPKWSKMWLYEVLDRFLLPRMDKVCLVSEHMKGIRALSRLKPDKVEVVENGIPSLLGHRIHSAHLKGGSRDTFKILAVGRLSPEKNMASLISALATDGLADADVMLYIVGEGRLRAALEQQARCLKVIHKVFFLGYRNDVPTLMRQANLLAIPSLTEGLPITLLEAMRCRLPVLACAVGGIPNALDNGNAGLLVTPGSDMAMVEQLEKVIAGKVDLDELSERALRRFNSCYTSDVMACKYSAIYSSLVTGKSRSARISNVEY